MINIENIKKSFGDHTVLNGVSFSIKKGSSVAIIAESGAGKTTLLRIIAGLEQADSGRVSGTSPSDIAVMFQEPRLFEHLSALSNITVPSKEPYEIAKEKAKVLLEEVGLLESSDKKPSELSGGMKQRVALARTFINDKDIVILDEPFSALDDETKSKMKEFVKKKTLGKTLIIVTHNKADAFEMSDSIYYLGQST